MSIYYYESSATNPWWNLSIEQVLASRIQRTDVLLYLWQNDRTIVIGRNQNALRECRADLLEKEGGYLARRSTGGGAVYHDMGNLCFTFAASPECYDLLRQMKVVQDACASLGVKTRLSGRNDIVTEDGYKFSGNAFSQTGNCHLQHGTLMVDVDQEMLQRYLTPSKLKLQAKGISSVRSRVCNLKQLAPQITIDSLKQALREAFCAEYGDYQVIGENDLDEKEVHTVYETKYASWEWRYGKTPKFLMEEEHLFAWGELQLQMELKGMRITDVRAYSDCLDETFPADLEQILTDTILTSDELNKKSEVLRETAAGSIEKAGTSPTEDDNQTDEANEFAEAANSPKAVSFPEEHIQMAIQVLDWLEELCR